MTETPSQQLDLSFGNVAYNNQYLFADHYLEYIITGDERWHTGLAEAEAFLDWLRELYEKERDQLGDYIESQLRDHWFNPILRRLGHTFEREAQVPGLGSGVRQPDYVFFPNEAARQAAVGVQKTEDYAQHALAVGEVKAWNTHLSKKRRGGGASFSDQNPSYQIDYYLKSTGLTWGILSNGRQWRLVHRESSYRLDTYYEVDLIALLEHDDANALRYFTLFFQQAAFLPDAQGRIFLDDVLAGSRAYAVALEEDLRENAYLALGHLMQGFYDYGPNHITKDDLHAVYENSLYLLYRLLFVLYSESRGLLPMGNVRYRERFGFVELKHKIAEDLNRGAYIPQRSSTYYDQLGNLFHLINGDDPQFNTEIRIVRYNGGLFDPAQHPFLARKRVGDRAFAHAVDLLCRRIRRAESESRAKEFVDYRTLNVRHLGSIYEGLLEYRPRCAEEAMVAVRNGNGGEQWMPEAQAPKGMKIVARRAPGEVYLETNMGERKTTGSYYTPQYIVAYIVEQTLGLLVKKMKNDEWEMENGGLKGEELVEAVLGLKVLDPAMGSGHFLVEATDYLARALATDPSVELPPPQSPPAGGRPGQDESDLNYWRRRVVERCIYGVDKNPLAVELAKLSLWLTTFAGDKPLGFLDHHLKCGDSLVGAEVADLGSPPPVILNHRRNNRVAEGQLNMFAHLLSQHLPVVIGKVMEIVSRESDSYETVRAKEAADRAMKRLKGPFEAVANLWASAYFGNEYGPDVYQEALAWLHEPATLFMMEEVLKAEAMAEDRHFFHWELVFPEVFFDGLGSDSGYGQPLAEEARGFDAVIGNPPWVNIGREPGYEALVQYIKATWQTAEYQVDLYTLFLELGIKKLRPHGYLGFIVPDPWLANYRTPKIRNLLLIKNQPLAMVMTPRQAFPHVGAEHMILIAQRSIRGCIQPFKKGTMSESGTVTLTETLSCEAVDTQNGYMIVNHNTANILRRIEKKSVAMGDLYETVRGVGPYHHRQHDKETIASRTFHAPYQKDETFVPELRGEHLNRYETTWDGQAWISYGNWLAEPREPRFFIGPRLLMREILGERLIACTLEEKFIVDRSIYIALQGDCAVSLNYVLAVVASRLLVFWFRERFHEHGELFPKLRVAHFNQLPIRRIAFTTPEDERARLLAEAQALYDADDHDTLLTFTAVCLAAAPEQADVVHDLLAYLAEQMIALNCQKQQRVDNFTLDLEGVSDPETFEALHEHGKWESSLWKAEACRPFVNQESRATRHLDESLAWNEDCFKAFVKLLAGRVANLSDVIAVYRRHHPDVHAIQQRIVATDRVIDRIVYQLYGLTEEDIAVINE